MTFLFRFMFRNLKGYRLFVVIAIFVSFASVACDIGAAYPLKWIPNKLQSDKLHPQNPEPIFDGLISFFDHFDSQQNLRQQITATNPHTVLGVILFSATVLVVFAL